MKVDVYGSTYVCAFLKRTTTGIMTSGRLCVFHLLSPHGVQIFIVGAAAAAAVMKCKELLLRFAWLSERNFVKTIPLLGSLPLHTIIDRFVGHLIMRRWEDNIKMDLHGVVFWINMTQDVVPKGESI
jgi:hypothetical protein